MSIIPVYPEFSKISCNMRDELDSICKKYASGIAEFTFSNLYLDTYKYNYTISRIEQNSIVIAGSYNNEKFFMIVGTMPNEKLLHELFDQFGYWKNLSDELVVQNKEYLQQSGFEIFEDRDNFDYLYDRNDLASLKGKNFHKKKNLVNSFVSNYEAKIIPLDNNNKSDAYSVLEAWNKNRDDEMSDYERCKIAIEYFSELHFIAFIAYAGTIPVAFSIGEVLPSKDGIETSFCVLFEKGLDEYKGCYQYINMKSTELLPQNITIINREQDLGNIGLRQAKMTYRPIGFTKKYKVTKPIPHS